MGKSLLTNLLVEQWRADGLNVLVCASSAKAAQLIGGMTVHAAFQLVDSGGFTTSNVNLNQHTEAWSLLYTTDVIVIDEVGVHIRMRYVFSHSSLTNFYFHSLFQGVYAYGEYYPCSERNTGICHACVQ